MQTRHSWGIALMRATLCILVWLAIGSRAAAVQEPVTPTPTPVPPACIGDCNHNGTVTVEELITMVDIALGNIGDVSCVAGDGNDDGGIDVAEIITAVNATLHGCPATAAVTVTPSPTDTPPTCGDGHIQPPEACDDGNTINGDGCSNCQVDLQYMCFGEPSQCFIVNCGEPIATCSGGPAVPTPTPTPPPP
jgi:cysteine-rich repeat protein